MKKQTAIQAIKKNGSASDREPSAISNILFAIQCIVLWIVFWFIRIA